MYAMQYEITLPADYDMGIIRQRIATKGPALDAFGGLGLKAYCVRERGIDGSPVNQYAPFYLWASVDGMNRFLWGGGGFDAIIESFGRPAVQHWTGVACAQGPARGVIPRAATRSVEAIGANAALRGTVDRAVDALRRRAERPGVHTTALAIDPRHWQMVQFTLWDDVPKDADGDRYAVLHLSTPYLADIRTGRQW